MPDRNDNPRSAFHQRRRARLIKKSEVRFGDQVTMRTQNSVYRLIALYNSTCLVYGGRFDCRGESNRVVIQGCTRGGSAIRTDLLAACGMYLEFGNSLQTSEIMELSRTSICSRN